MGVERKEARKALKFTGSVEAAIGLLFEGDRTLLDNVSDHEDEPEELKKEKITLRNDLACKAYRFFNFVF